MAKKFAKKIATYAMAATMIGEQLLAQDQQAYLLLKSIHLQQQPNQLIVR